ncbi:MAG: hypothetical protein NTW59_00705 [Candidatus Diapherotrites archaeon]|nr:hypothetical protein [Candidatus Diapherotrites archaeon]
MVLFVLALACSVQAEVFLIEPVDTKLSDSGEAFFGQMACGETMRVIVNKKSGMGAPWDEIAVDPSTLPPGWKAVATETDKTLIAEITAPANAIVSTQRLRFVLSNSSQPPFFAESFFGSVSVRENLLAVTIENLQQRTVVGSTVQFRLNLNNDSIASNTVLVRSSLPEYWFKPVEVELQPKESKTLALDVFVFSYGERQFSSLAG